MNHVCRQRWVAVCLLIALLSGTQASAQFLRQEIIEAEKITDAMRSEVLALVDPAVKKLMGGEPAAVSEARDTLIKPMRDSAGSAAFREAYSAIVSGQLTAAASHEKVLIRINAMIVCAQLIDKGSLKLVEQGLKDTNPAVQRKAMDALRRRVQFWLTQGRGVKAAQDGIADAVKTVNSLLDQRPAPHPIVVSPAMLMFLDIDTPESYALLVEHLNKRLAVHAADPSLPYYGEQVVIDRLVRLLTTRPNAELSTGTMRASWRFSSLILEQVKAGKLERNDLQGATAMLGQSLLAMGQLTAAAGKAPPQGQFNAKNWVQNQDWDQVRGLVLSDWKPILQADPFKLTDKDLAIK